VSQPNFKDLTGQRILRPGGAVVDGHECGKFIADSLGVGISHIVKPREGRQHQNPERAGSTRGAVLGQSSQPSKGSGCQPPAIASGMSAMGKRWTVPGSARPSESLGKSERGSGAIIAASPIRDPLAASGQPHNARTCKRG
jgi:hypothetical protein